MTIPAPMGPLAVEYALTRVLATVSTVGQLARLAGLPNPDDDWPEQVSPDQLDRLEELIRRRIAAGTLTTADRPRRKGGAG